MIFFAALFFGFCVLVLGFEVVARRSESVGLSLDLDLDRNRDGSGGISRLVLCLMTGWRIADESCINW